MGDEIVYHEGWPPEQAWYDVIVDGQEDRLRHWICKLSGRHEWIDVNGQYIRGSEVRWCGEGELSY